MSAKEQFRDRVLNPLNRCFPVTARAMFGGYGLYREGVMFALIADEALYFKVDAENRGDFLAADMEPFFYWRHDRRIQMSYYRLPVAVFERQEILATWIEKACAAGRRTRQTLKKKTRSMGFVPPKI